MGRVLGVLGVALYGTLPVWAGSPPAPPSDEQAAERLALVAGDGFRTYEAEHFLVAYDTPFEALSPLVGRLEGTYDAIWQFCEACALNTDPPASRFEVILFDRYEDFARYAAGVGLRAKSIAGFYEQRANRSAFCNTFNSPDIAPLTRQIDDAREQLRRASGGPSNSPAARGRRRELQRWVSMLTTERDVLAKRFNRFVIQHEAAHQMLFNLGVHVRGGANPQWLVEGLACQFEVPQADSRGALRRINHMRLDDLRTALQVPPSARAVSDDAYRAALDSGQIVSVRELVCDPTLFAGGKHVVFRYAQAWALVFYLQRQHGEPLAHYLRGLTTRRPGEPVAATWELVEFEAAFGKVDDAFERGWLSYMLRVRLDRKEAGR